MRRWTVGILITLVLAAAGGVLAWRIAAPGIPSEPPVTERARAASAVLAGAHVYVDPSVDGVFTDDQLARLEDAAAASDPEVFVVVWPDSDQAGYGFSRDVLRQIGTATGRPGLYLEVSPGEDVDSLDVGMEGEHFSVFGPAVDGAWTSDAETARLLEEIAENDGREYTLGEDTGSEYWGGTAGTITAGLLIGGFSGLIAAVLGLIGWAQVRRRRAAA